MRHEIDLERWAKFSLAEQMGNAGAEVGRALAAKRTGNRESMMGALYRGIDLLNATACIWAKKKSPRAREILRMRDQFVEAILTERDDPRLEHYFMWFALIARSDR